MCGICGIYNLGDGRIIEDNLIKRMCDIMKHRGPDGEGVYITNEIALGHRRLSIIDLAGGTQPIYNEDKSILIVFNGEIYNFMELRHALETKGHRFYTNSDTEVIVHLYEEEGDECVQKLRGMFAFAIWDTKKKWLFIARDRLGIKPLYYGEFNKQLIFASEIKAILQHPDVKRQVNPQSLDRFLTLQYVPAPDTMLVGIKKLLPGHILTVIDGNVAIKKYWSLQEHLSENQPEKCSDEDYYVKRLTDLLRESVRLRLVSDVPLGAFLSGGIDSSLVVALMSELMDSPVNTFSVGFDAEAKFNELKYASLVAETFGTNHHELFVKPTDVIKFIPKVIWHLDEPLADYASLPTYLISDFARQYVKVALSGEGADELFGGYRRYFYDKCSRVYQRLPLSLQELFNNCIGRLPRTRRLKQALKAFKICSDFDRAIAWVALYDENQKLQLYSKDFGDSLQHTTCLSTLYDSIFQRVKKMSPLDKMLYFDIQIWLPDNLLMKVDKMSMMASLEARVPFLDHRLVEFALSIPANLKVKGTTTKYILKRAAKNILPEIIINRRKHGFALPIDTWLRKEMVKPVREILLDPCCLRRGYFNHKFIEELIDAHVRGISDNSFQIWLLLNFELWCAMYIDKNETPLNLSIT